MTHATHDPPAWVPRAGLRIRWDRALDVGDAVFRWHTRLDGSALLHGPAGHLRVGDVVTMPVGHLHRAGEVAPVRYDVRELYEDDRGQAWIRAVRAVPAG